MEILKTEELRATLSEADIQEKIDVLSHLRDVFESYCNSIGHFKEMINVLLDFGLKEDNLEIREEIFNTDHESRSIRADTISAIHEIEGYWANKIQWFLCGVEDSGELVRCMLSADFDEDRGDWDRRGKIPLFVIIHLKPIYSICFKKESTTCSFLTQLRIAHNPSRSIR